ncbi:MAG: hypothetical protein J4F36_08175 [Nitrosopumilaceae archaeon]|nr:hypothetical protein [Nitrosopumilaceae archaeon]
MKNKFLIIIGIIIALGSASAFVTIDYFDKLSLEEFPNLSHPLQSVLDYCEEKKTGNDMNLIGLHYFNDTHYIDNNICQWQVLEKYPNSDKLCIPRQDSNDIEIRNNTHIYDKNKCLWEEELNWEKEWKNKFTDPQTDPVYSHPFGSDEEDYRNLEPIYRDNPNNPGELILDLDAMIKKYGLENEN